MSNYPNPFNPETFVQFSLPENSNIKIIIYDILGNEVITLAEGYYSKGNYNVKWDGRNKERSPVTSGIYLVKMVTETKSLVRKITLIR